MTARTCADCHRPLRIRTTPSAQAPGTVIHAAHGLCGACLYRRRRRATRAATAAPIGLLTVPDGITPDVARTAALTVAALVPRADVAPILTALGLMAPAPTTQETTHG